MYLISECSCTEDVMVRNVVGSINEENMISVTWDWPRSREWPLCVVYVLDEDITLEEIIRKKLPGTVYENSFGLRHTMELENASAIVKVYPARKMNRDTEVLNQVRENSSDIFYRRVNLSYHVDYKSGGLFSQTKTAHLQIRGIHELNGGYVVYRCIGEGRSNILYPIDVEKFGNMGVFQITISKKEEIQLDVTERQRQYITLSRY